MRAPTAKPRQRRHALLLAVVAASAPITAGCVGEPECTWATGRFSIEIAYRLAEPARQDVEAFAASMNATGIQGARLQGFDEAEGGWNATLMLSADAKYRQRPGGGALQLNWSRNATTTRSFLEFTANVLVDGDGDRASKAPAVEAFVREQAGFIDQRLADAFGQARMNETALWSWGHWCCLNC